MVQQKEINNENYCIEKEESLKYLSGNKIKHLQWSSWWIKTENELFELQKNL